MFAKKQFRSKIVFVLYYILIQCIINFADVTLEEQILGTSENVVESEVNIGSQPSCVSPELKVRRQS